MLARAPRGLKGAAFEFPYVSVGATENLLMAAALAEGETVLGNAAREPEIEDLGHCLIAMGAKISGLGTSQHRCRRRKANWGGATHSVLPDRIETGTYAIAAAIAGGEVELLGTRRELIGALVPLLERSGARDRPTTNRGLMVARNGARPFATDVDDRSRFRAFPPICRRNTWR